MLSYPGNRLICGPLNIFQRLAVSFYVAVSCLKTLPKFMTNEAMAILTRRHQLADHKKTNMPTMSKSIKLFISVNCSAFSLKILSLEVKNQYCLYYVNRYVARYSQTIHVFYLAGLNFWF